MLRELSIKNFAVIADLHITFPAGLTILSGETGAGKSIIINSVNLLLGGRASASLIRTGSEALELEALFQIDPDSRAALALAGFGFDAGEELLIRRIITRNKKQRVYINGHQANVRMLSAVTANLAGISGQHAHHRLLKEEDHLLILDQFAGLIDLRNNLSVYFNKMLPLIKKLRALKTSQTRRTDQIELLKFQKKEILEASIQIDEDAELEQERLLLKNREALLRAGHHGLEIMYTGEGAVVERLAELEKDLSRLSAVDKKLEQTARRIADAALQIEDIAEELRSYLGDIRTDDKRLEQVEERIDLLHKLKRKYGGTLKNLFSFLNKIETKLNASENISDKITQTEREITEIHSRITELATEISAKRSIAAAKLAEEVEKELSCLKMHNTTFKILLDSVASEKDADPFLSVNGRTINETGLDRARFLIAPNIGETLKPLANIASGGELSRIVLALKAIMAKTESLETIVFDEVDAGIGGSVAEAAGKKLALLARHHQVICITHLPQIAKFGDQHYRISKQIKNHRVKVVIEPVSGDKRVTEIARMLGGETITAATIEHARELLRQVS